MRELIAGVLFFTIMCTASTGAENRFHTSVTLDRILIPSSQDATATLTIVNNSNAPISFDDAGVVFLERFEKQWLARPRYTGGQAIVTQAQHIAAHSAFKTSITLPSCQVQSEPCTQDVVMQYRVGEPTGYRLLRTPVLHYEFVPDPAATYRLVGLSGNRPAFLTYGVATDTIFPDSLIVKAAASEAEMQSGSIR